MTTIARAFRNTLSIDGGCRSIAHLAQFAEFDPSMAKRFDTSQACIAIDALKEHYEGHEMDWCEADYHSGGIMTFKDGSQIRFH